MVRKKKGENEREGQNNIRDEKCMTIEIKGSVNESGKVSRREGDVEKNRDFVR